MNENKLLIGGVDVAARNDATFERKSPITGAVVTKAAAASAEDARAACDAAAKAFPAWAALGPNARRKLLLEAAAKLRSHSADFSRLCVEETGAIGGWGHFNTAFAAGLLEEAAAMATQVTGETIPSDHAGTIALGLRQPAGVCVGMAPWNAPVILGVRAIAMPLACGNTVVLKGSEMCPAVHRLIVDAFVEAGLPGGVVNYVSHAAADAPAVVEALIAHPAVKRVADCVCFLTLSIASFSVGGKASSPPASQDMLRVPSSCDLYSIQAVRSVVISSGRFPGLQTLIEFLEARVETLDEVIQSLFKPLSSGLSQTDVAARKVLEFVNILLHLKKVRRGDETDFGQLVIDALQSNNGAKLITQNSKRQQHQEADTQNHPAGDAPWFDIIRLQFVVDGLHVSHQVALAASALLLPVRSSVRIMSSRSASAIVVVPISRTIF